MNCDICGISCTGIFNYQQHIDSEKHKKKVKQQEILNSGMHNAAMMTRNSSGIEAPFFCSVCKVSYYDLNSYQLHVISLEHADMVKNSLGNKVENKESELDTIGGITSSQNLDSEFKNQSSKDSPILPPTWHESLIPNYKYCQPCNKQFSGIEPYQQHIVSKAHLKIVNGVESSNKLLEYTCQICDKQCSGAVPYNEHLKSEVHKKKIRKNGLFCQSKYKDSLVDCSVTSTNSPGKDIAQNTSQNPSFIFSPWYCFVCQMQCTGPVPYSSHLSGQVHKKKEAKAKLEAELLNNSENNNQLSDMSLEKQQTWSTEKMNPVTQHMAKKGFSDAASELMESHQLSFSNNKQIDAILPQPFDKSCDPLTIENLGVIPFHPDSKLNFDLETKNDVVAQAKIKSEIYKEFQSAPDIQEVDMTSYYTCEICDVDLQNKEEVASHYESIEHYIKKINH